MVGRSEHDEPILEQGRRLKLRNAAVSGSDSEVYLALKDGLANALRDHVCNLHANAWMGFDEAAYEFWEHSCADSRESCDSNKPGRGRTQISCMFNNRARIIKEPLQGAEDISSRSRECNAALASFKESNAQALLELLYLNGQCRLRYMELVCGAREIARFPNLEESTDLPKLVHHRGM